VLWTCTANWSKATALPMLAPIVMAYPAEQMGGDGAAASQTRSGGGIGGPLGSSGTSGGIGGAIGEALAKNPDGALGGLFGGKRRTTSAAAVGVFVRSSTPG
jgi:uncharacterized protein YidB (DUF937 family)